MSQQIGCITMVVGCVVMVLYLLVQSVYDFISGLWTQTLLPFFHGPVWAVIAIGIATFLAYGLYMAEIDEKKENNDDVEIPHNQEPIAVERPPVAPNVAPTNVQQIQQNYPYNSQSSTATPANYPIAPQSQPIASQNGNSGAIAGPVSIQSFETGAASNSENSASNQGKAGDNQ